MRAIQIKKHGMFDIIQVEMPSLKKDEILVEMKYMALCNQHDLKVNKGLYTDLKYLEYGVPGFPGHEGSGIVADIGVEMDGFEIGDHVVLSGLGGPPLYAEFVTRKADTVARIDKNFPLDQVAMAELFGCVYRACKKISDYRGKSVAVSGCGPGGLAAIQICRILGAVEVIALDINQERLTLATALGADRSVSAGDSKAMLHLAQNGVDFVIECSGNKIAYRRAFDIARNAIVNFGYSEGMLELPLWPMFDHELTIYNSKWLTTSDLQSVVDLIASGRMRTDLMISARVDFTGYPYAVEMAGRGEVVKVIMTP